MKMAYPNGWKPIYLILVLFLVGCADQANLTTQQSLFDTQTRYTKLGAVALHYVSLPLCLPPPLDLTLQKCADENVVRVIQRVDREVFNVLLAAEAARGTLDEEMYRTLAASALKRLRLVIVKHAIEEAIK